MANICQLTPARAHSPEYLSSDCLPPDSPSVQCWFCLPIPASQNLLVPDINFYLPHGNSLVNSSRSQWDFLKNYWQPHPHTHSPYFWPSSSVLGKVEKETVPGRLRSSRFNVQTLSLYAIQVTTRRLMVGWVYLWSRILIGMTNEPETAIYLRFYIRHTS